MSFPDENNNKTTNESAQGCNTPADDSSLNNKDYSQNQFSRQNGVPNNFNNENQNFQNNSPNNQEQFKNYQGINMPYPNTPGGNYSSQNFWQGINVQKKPKKKISPLAIILMIILLLLVSAVMTVAVKGRGWLANTIAGDQHIQFTLPIAEIPKPSDDANYQIDGRYTAQGIAEAISPSIVSIEIYQSGASYMAMGQGSGIIMTEDGYILTNAHVIDGASKGIKVVLHDGSEYQADIIGMDIASDVAVIKVSAKDLIPVQFGDSTEVKLGEEIVTIGSPAGYYGSVTRGIVSGLNREVKVETAAAAMDCIQIDAAINPGNSGGALLNMWGQVIGITSSKLASSDYDGIGFAISIDAAKPIIESLMEHGYVPNRVKIGITFYAITDTTADMYETKPGIYVVSIDETCDIANTDLKVDDIITEIDGKIITDADELKSYLLEKKPGDTVKAKVFRPDISGKSKDFEIEFKLMEDKSSLIESTE